MRELAFSVVLAAAGTGTRMGGCKKPLLELAGQSVLQRAVHAVRSAEGCAEVIVVMHPDEAADEAFCRQLRDDCGVAQVVPGGSVRQESVRSGVAAVREDIDVVLVHDAARPLVDPDVVRQVAEAAAEFGAAIAAVPCSDTVKEVGEAHVISRTVPRERLWLAHSPQGARKDLLLEAQARAQEEGFLGTDEAQIIERLGHQVRVVLDSRDNLKITLPEDLAIAEAILRWRDQQP